MLFAELAATSGAVAATTKRNDKVAVLAEVLGRLDLDEIAPAVAFLVGTTPLGRVGVGWAALSAARPDPALSATLTVAGVDRAIRGLDALSGDGVAAARRAQLDQLLARATADEQRLLVGVLGGELRQGANEGVLVSAVAAAADVPVAAVRRAAMLSGRIDVAAGAALIGGRTALDAIELEPGRAVQPMLASTASSVADSMAARRTAAT
ncbi:MAG: ATP-dependent DNA ligase, partial [Actinomycetota bacterium]